MLQDLSLFLHQKKFVDSEEKRHILVWETGTGKSLAILHKVAKLGESALFISPKTLKGDWNERMWDFFKLESERHMLMTKEEFRRDWDNIPRANIIVVDESHYFHGKGSQMNKSLKSYIKKHGVEYVYLLTATPYRSSPYDIQEVLDILGYPINKTEFFNRYFTMIKMGARMIPKPKSGIEAELTSLIHRVGTTVRMADCVDVPEQVFETEFFKLTRDQQKGIAEAYDPMPIIRYTREHQICGGTLKSDEYQRGGSYYSLKLERLKELVQQNKRAVVVSRYNSEIRLIEENIRSLRPTFVINGETPQAERVAVLRQLRNSSDYVLIVNAKIAEGWELPDCPLMIFYSLDYQLVSYIQMLGRINRIGNLKNNVYLHLVVKNSVDEQIYKTVVINKQDFHIRLYNQEEHGQGA